MVLLKGLSDICFLIIRSQRIGVIVPFLELVSRLISNRHYSRIGVLIMIGSLEGCFGWLFGAFMSTYLC